MTEDEIQKTRELFDAFCPPLPTTIDEKPQTVRVTPLEDPEITKEEVRTIVLNASPWKAPGRDGLPIAMWQRIWPAVEEEVIDLFRASFNEGYLHHQWRAAKIKPLKKPGKANYRPAKAWRPISFLATLGKVLEAVIAERISFASEMNELLPTNHFGARRRRSAEQALILLQEHICKSWRGQKVLSLISFDVKGA